MCSMSLASKIVVADSIVWGNVPRSINSASLLVVYSDIAGVGGAWSGVGNKNVDPAFVMPGYWANPNDLTKPASPDDQSAVWVHGYYHLMSKAGRWDPVTKTWVKDAVTSPCIDAGDPASLVGAEPSPNGNRINMGAYGGTSQASLSTSGQ